MSIQVLLDLIRQRFSPSDRQILAMSLPQDPLVWRFIQDDMRSQDYFDSAQNTLDAYTPSQIAAWLVQQETGIVLPNLKDPDAPLPKAIKQRAAEAFETTLNTGLPPVDFFTAGLLALTLRERRSITGSWEGITEEIFNCRSKTDIHKKFLLWRTPFACLIGFCSDFDELLTVVLKTKSEMVLSTSIPIFLHAYLANPFEPQSQLDNLSGSIKSLDVDHQLEALKWLGVFNRIELQKSLAVQLIQTKNHVDYFAGIFSEFETLQNQNTDPLLQPVRLTLSEDLNRIAALNYYSGNDEKASELYQKASLVLDLVKNQTRFQSVTCFEKEKTPSEWLSLVNALPGSKTARLSYIRVLLYHEAYGEAAKQLKELPDSVEKELLQQELKQDQDDQLDLSNDIDELLTRSREDGPQIAGYFAHTPQMDPAEEILEVLQNSNDLNQSVELSQKFLESNRFDPETIGVIRDIYIKANQLDKAITLTSYLDLAEPENINHKQTLAELYTQTKRWQDAFATSQEIVKTENDPDIMDLVRFAKSAMATDRLEMGISICQNILQQAPNNTQALVLLGEGYMAKGDPVKAIHHMEQVVEMVPDEADTWLALAQLWKENGQTDRAFEILNQGVLALPQSAPLNHALGKAHLEKQAPADAHSCLKKALEINPENDEIQIDYAQAKYDLGEYAQACKLLEPFVENYQYKPSVAKLLGRVLLAMDEKHKAESILLFAAKTSPQDMDTLLTAVHLTLERIESSLDKPLTQELEALQHLLEKAQNIHHDDHRLQLHLADVLRLKGNHQKAFNAYLAISESDQAQKTRESWRFSYGLGQAALSLGDDEVGLAALQEAHSKQPGNLIVLHALSSAYLAADLCDKAQQTAKTALKMAPQDIDNILWYAHFKRRNNEPQEAVKALKEALQIMPDRPDLQYWLSKSLYDNGNLQKAKQILQKVISGSQSPPELLQKAAYLGVQLNEVDLAVNALEKAQQDNMNNDATLVMDLSLCHTMLGERKKALEVLDLSDDILEEYPQLSMLKSDLLCELGQYRMALNVLKSVEDHIKTTLDNGDEKKQSPLLYQYDFSIKGFHYRMGLLLRALGDIKDAQDQLSQALTCEPEDMQIRSAYVESLAAGMNFEKALAVCDETIPKQLLAAKGAPAHLDIDWLQTELRLLQGHTQDAKAIFDEINVDVNTPSALALQSQIAFSQGDLENAEIKFRDTIDVYTKEVGSGQNHTLQSAFRKFRTLLTIAEAALNLEAFSKAQHFHNLAANIFNNQPLQNWRHAKALIKAAEAQQIASILDLKAHAPGEGMRSEGQYETCQALIDKVSPYLPEESSICLKSQCVAAFTGTWPTSLHIDPCLQTPENAALVLINYEDEDVVQQIIEAYPNDPKICQAYGLHALRFGKDDGTKYVENALQMDVSNPVNHVLLAFLNRQDPELALKSLKTALSYWPKESGWHALAGELYQLIGDSDSASHHLARALKTEPENADYWQKSAEIKLKRNSLREAKQDLEKSVTLQSSDPQTWTKMADVNRRLGNFSEALQNIQEASRLAPKDKDVIKKEINFLLEQKRFVDAEHKAQTLIEQEQEVQDWHILLARARTKQGKFDQALEGLNKAYKGDTQNTKISLEAIKTKKERDGTETVLPELITLAQNYPEDPEVLTTLTDWLIQTNRLKEAEETAQTILRIIPDQAEVHLMLGRLQRKTGQLDQAISHFADAIHHDPHLIEAYLELGKTYQDRRNLEQAIKIYEEGARVDNADPRPYFHAGMALKDCKDYTAAEAMLRQAKKFAPDDPLIIRQLGVITALNLVNNLRETS